MSPRLLVVVAAALVAFPVHAQEGVGRVTVRVRSEAGPVDRAEVRSAGVRAWTDSQGGTTLRLPAGERELSVRKLGFTPASVRLSVRAGADTTITVQLSEQPEELEAIIVSSTRSGQRIEDEPTRVEVLSREEVEEKMLMTPGDIAMMLNETSGLRVQSTSPSLGGASVRIQGLRGRYTQVLSDGLPLYGGQSGALGLLQIPPMDLGQVEVIKGGASALYGSSALGGVINLISRRPEDDREVLLNQTTRGGTDGVLWLSKELGDRWGYTLLGSAH
ncbi:MAG: TonB-dependent receptor plug domain-containing protein, partial [Gemmatimonadota bacterium]|nr:TonB-dependent receptor plug domain-containing protein [Gemmatimonadota bacterium]